MGCPRNGTSPICRGKMSTGEAFHEILWAYRDSAATDGRDMIYGLLGIATAFPIEVEADFSLRKKVVYQQVTMSSIQQTRKLHILEGERILGGEMPSWIYDWSSRIDQYRKDTCGLTHFLFQKVSEVSRHVFVPKTSQL